MSVRFHNEPRRRNPFRVRKIVDVADEPPRSIRFMTYNVLTQTQCQPSKTRTSGQSMPWSLRFAGMRREIEAYDPDILLLQEVDRVSIPQWVDFLNSAGLFCYISTHPKRSFGLVTACRHELWECESYKMIIYDDIELEGIPRKVETNCVGLVLVLRPVDYYGDGIFYAPITVANTHLVWYPNAEYERARQALLLLEVVRDLANDSGSSRMLLGGDLNSVPTGAVYKILTGDRESYDVYDTLIRSVMSTDFGRLPCLLPNGMGYDNCISNLLDGFSSLRMSGVSLYAANYENVDEWNTFDGELQFTTWTTGFKETIDYLMVIFFEEEEREGSVVTYKLLRMPRLTELGPLPNTLPRIGYYPSDHLTLMAEIGWVPDYYSDY